jgi:hypothetical protein
MPLLATTPPKQVTGGQKKGESPFFVILTIHNKRIKSIYE